MTNSIDAPHGIARLEVALMYSNRLQFARPTLTWVVCLATFVALIGAPLTVAQAPAASGNAAQAPTPAELEKLVGPIALYPDDLVAIILPASTNPLQLVQADRFLEKRKKDPKAPIDDKWDESVKSLVNYPEVVKQMSADLDWTTGLGEAVVANQGAVLGAVQAFRRKVQAAGNLKTDAKQVVVVEKEVIKIVPADPQVIYVPQYSPATVVVVSTVPVYAYYPSPYPVYYYPYPPGAALATGLVWGAAMGAAWSGNHYGTNWSGGNNNITINRGNTNINTGNINTGNINRTNTAQNTAWKSDKKPGQVSTASARPATTSARVGDTRPTGTGGGGAATRPSTQAAGGAAQGAATRSQASGAQSRDALGGYGSGSAARADSSRGASSVSSMSSQGARSTASAGSRGGSSGGSAGGSGRRR
jgi:Protein of unknown function (DUF3300)